MTDLRTAAQQALEAMRCAVPTGKITLYAWDKAMANLRAALAEPVEPVAWLTPKTVDSYMRPDLGYETCSKTDYAAFPVYTAPPQRKPLTEEEIAELTKSYPASSMWRLIVSTARAIERAHGIGGAA